MLRSRLLALALSLFCAAASAAPATEDALVPVLLKDWRPWVLKDLDYRACPFFATQAPGDASTYVCAWPSRLSLDATASGAKFSVHWRVDAPSWIALPGDVQQWPQGVTVNNQRQPVLNRIDAPALWLMPGSYDIAGSIFWHERPQSLRVPPNLGLIALSVDGKQVLPIQREGEQLTLGRSEASTPEADSADVRVFRKLADGVPALLTTQIYINVSGQAREEVLGPVLPAGFEATSLAGDWPARLDDDGRLHVQVQPGDSVLTVGARAIAPLGVVTARLPEKLWPKQEVWSYVASPRLRITSPAATLAVDPHQAEVPAEWVALPAFALGNDDKITIEERSRGLAPDEANRLNLHREAWLDFNGDGWFARDSLSGEMVQGWRLDVAAPLTLEHAEANASRALGGQPESLLVTKGAKDQANGVEWRTPTVDLTGGVRIAAASSLPASGWQQTFDRIDTTLHFPFGYKLFGAPGADSVVGSWMSSWTLLDVFIAAILVLLAWRLLGVFGAVAAVGYVLLGYQESGAPFWTLLALLALALITRVLPAGKLQRVAEWSRRGALLLLILCALPFLADQVRFALYPQLENGSGESGANAYVDGALYRHKLHRVILPGSEDAVSLSAPVAPPPPPAMASPPPPPAAANGGRTAALSKSDVRDAAKPALESVIVTGSRIQQSQLIDHYSQSTVVQTGAGEPGWNLGSTATLSWSGPVLPTQTVQLIIAPPWVVRLLRFVLTALLVWLIWHVFRSVPFARSAGVRPAANVAGLVLLASLVMSMSAQAQTVPSEELLQQLRERLTEAPKCAPACASVAQAQIAASGDTLNVVLEVHAGERIAYPLPAIDKAAMLKSVKVDANADAPIARTVDGQSWLALDRGVHRIELDYVAYADKTSLSFALPPGRVLFDGRGWSASGLQDDHLLAATLTLARARDATQGKPVFGAQQFAPYVSVQRALSLGLDWTISTQVQRISPATGGFTLNLPLVAGEHVASGGIKVHNDNDKGALATIGIPDGSDSASWNSTLDKGDALTLTAPLLTDHAEVWRVLVSPTWHVEFSGVPGVGRAVDEDGSDYRNFEFHPLPGESLTLKITRPAPTQGAVRAIDSVTLSSEGGQRAASGVLQFTLRASQGGEQAITLPQDAQIIGVTRDQEVLNLRAVAGKLSLPVKPGAQVFEIRFRDNTLIGIIAHTPAIALGLPAANIDLSLALPADRWLLAASGPAVGPAVLYWGELVLMVVIAFVLARSQRTRLKFHHWLLLGLGFSTFSWFALMVVVAWLFAFDWRARRAAPASWWRFDLVQIALAALTVAALFCLVSAIQQGLLGQPDMQIVGYNSHAHAQALRWFADRSTDALPQASTISLPLWVYKVLMLAWALWLANALIGWLREGFAAWTSEGYWRSRVRAVPVPVPAPSVAESAPIQPEPGT